MMAGCAFRVLWRCVRESGCALRIWADEVNSKSDATQSISTEALRPPSSAFQAKMVVLGTVVHDDVDELARAFFSSCPCESRAS